MLCALLEDSQLEADAEAAAREDEQAAWAELISSLEGMTLAELDLAVDDLADPDRNYRHPDGQTSAVRKQIWGHTNVVMQSVSQNST